MTDATTAKPTERYSDMARMHPNYRDDELEREITSPGAYGEIRLYRELRDQLPDDWDVLYNNCIFASGKNIQTDFLVFSPGRGVVNVDAKGRGYRYEDNSWYLNGRPDDIFFQAQSAIHTFNEYVRANFSTRFPWGAYGYLVVFIEEPELNGIIPGNCAHMRPGELRDGRLREFIERQLGNFPQLHNYFTAQMYRTILDHFCVKFGFLPFSFEFHDNDRKLKPALTERQNEILAAVEEKQFVHVTGGAGTGKTVLAMACARSFAARGEKVLYVCYNKSLSENLSRSCPSEGDITITHYDTIPGKLFDLTVPLAQDRSGGLDWDETHRRISEMICTHGAQLAEEDKFDLILIDEAQDMNTEMLFSLQFLARKNARIAFFSDSTQSIFQKGWQFPEKDYPGIETCRLRVNLRNTDNIHGRIIRYSGEKTVPGRFIAGRSPENFDCSVTDLVHKLKNVEGIRASDIAVLCYDQDALAGIANRTEDGICFTSNFGGWNEKKILKTTVRSFKGLEANVIIVADADHMPPLEEAELNHLRYVCESRAKYRLYLHRAKK